VLEIQDGSQLTESSNIPETMTRIIKIPLFFGVKLSSSGLSDFVGRRRAPEIQYGSQITLSSNNFVVFTGTHVVPKPIQGFITMYETHKCPAIITYTLPLHHRRAMLVVAKRVTWTLHPKRPRKTGSKYNNILSCVGKPNGSVTISQKNGCLISLLTMRFSTKKTHWGSFHPPVAGIRVKAEIFQTT